MQGLHRNRLKIRLWMHIGLGFIYKLLLAGSLKVSRGAAIALEGTSSVFCMYDDDDHLANNV